MFVCTCKREREREREREIKRDFYFTLNAFWILWVRLSQYMRVIIGQSAKHRLNGPTSKTGWVVCLRSNVFRWIS